MTTASMSPLHPRIDNLLLALGFELDPPVTLSAILREVHHDKKLTGDTINLVLPVVIGECRVVAVPYAELQTLF